MAMESHFDFRRFIMVSLDFINFLETRFFITWNVFNTYSETHKMHIYQAFLIMKEKGKI